MIPFNKPYIVGKELYYISQAVQGGNLAGDGPFTEKCCDWLEDKYNLKKTLLVHSCTAALEMAAILCDIKPGDEVIMPSYTFVSTANAFVLRGGVPVFVDIKQETMNIDENKIEAAITQKTKVIVPVHYAGVGCNMDKIMGIAEKYKLLVVEDAAQGVNALYKNKFLGSIGHLGCYSFHETKNYISGEGGALIINDDRFIKRAEIIREKGTNRSQFFRGEVDKYTWVDIGSSYLASELTAAFLYAQLEEADKINSKRLKIWNTYYDGLKTLDDKGLIKLPRIMKDRTHNGHMFYLTVKNEDTRSKLIDFLKKHNIHSVFHYVPLHTSPMAGKSKQHIVSLPITEDLSNRLLRLPCYFDIKKQDIIKIINKIKLFYGLSKSC